MKATPSTIATPATAPTTIPAIAPPDRESEESLFGLDTGEVVIVPVAVGVIGVVVHVVDVEVPRSSVAGSKAHVLQVGASEVKDDYKSSSTSVLTLRNGLRSLFQQTFRCSGTPVHSSLSRIAGQNASFTVKEERKANQRFIETAPVRTATATGKLPVIVGAIGRQRPAYATTSFAVK
jgi:hypothetical protein